MLLNLSNNLDREKFNIKAMAFLRKGSVVELTERTPKTPNQNRYLHLLIGIVAMETGNSLEDAKREYFKKLVNPHLFVYNKTDRMGNTIEVVRSITDPYITQERMSEAIDRFKKWGYENSIYMPNPDDTSLLRDIEIEMGRNQYYL